MALYVGIDPGGVPNAWAYICATADGWDRIVFGRLRDAAAAPPHFNAAGFPYLDPASLASLQTLLMAAMDELAALLQVPAGHVPALGRLSNHYGSLFVAVDAPSGFAVPGNHCRNTEGFAGPNFATPAEPIFVAQGTAWENGVPRNVNALNAQILWKSVGLTIYRYYSGAATAAALAAIESAGITPNFHLHLVNVQGIRVLESFPSCVYTRTTVATNPAAMALAAQVAGRSIIQFVTAPLNQGLVGVKALMAAFAQGNWAQWQHAGRGITAGCRDAFASMMLGIWGCQPVGLLALGNNLPLLGLEGAIFVAA
jgi:hypothetical protein